MLLAFDTYYLSTTAKTVCIAFEHWQDESPAQTHTAISEIEGEYEPGAFYKRELPCILGLLAQINEPQIDAIIVDSFVVLDDDGKLGLGGHLFERLDGKIPIIGVAKTNFATLHALKREVRRGESQKPLYVTAMGMDIDEASAHVLEMHGTYRIPTLLKLLDVLTKS